MKVDVRLLNSRKKNKMFWLLSAKGCSSFGVINPHDGSHFDGSHQLVFRGQWLGIPSPLLAEESPPEGRPRLVQLFAAFGGGALVGARY